MMFRNHGAAEGLAGTRGVSSEQYAILDGLARRQPFSVFVELNNPLVRGRSGFCRGPRLDGPDVIAAVGRCRGDGGAFGNSRGLLLVLFFADWGEVPGGNAFTQSDFRLRPVSGKPDVVGGTGLSGERFHLQGKRDITLLVAFAVSRESPDVSGRRIVGTYDPERTQRFRVGLRYSHAGNSPAELQDAARPGADDWATHHDLYKSRLTKRCKHRLSPLVRELQ